MVKEGGFIDKKWTVTMFSNVCSSCPRKTSCINASSMNSGERQYLLYITHHRQRDIAGRFQYGIKFHEKMQEGIKGVEDFDPREFYGDLLSGKTVVLKEAPLCNPVKGFRGHPDILILKYDPTNKHLFIRIIELKTGFKPSYFLQLTVYGLILSTPEAIIHFNDDEYFKLYPFPFNDIKITLEGIFKVKSGGKVNNNIYRMIENNIPTKRFITLSKAVLKRRKEFQRYHKPGIYELSTIKCRGTCPIMGGDGDTCGYDLICKDVGYRKSKQLYLGKKKLLVKTKPYKPSKVVNPPIINLTSQGLPTNPVERPSGNATLDRFLLK